MALKFRRSNLEATDLDQLLQTRIVSIKNPSAGVPHYLETVDNIDIALSVVFYLITRADPSTDYVLQIHPCP